MTLLISGCSNVLHGPDTDTTKNSDFKIEIYMVKRKKKSGREDTIGLLTLRKADISKSNHRRTSPQVSLSITNKNQSKTKQIPPGTHWVRKN